MSNEFFDELSTSLNQALNIAKGEVNPSRKFSYDIYVVKNNVKSPYIEKNTDIKKLVKDNR